MFEHSFASPVSCEEVEEPKITSKHPHPHLQVQLLVLTTAVGPSNPVSSLSDLSIPDTEYQHDGPHSLRRKYSHHKNRKVELERQSATTNLGTKRIRAICTRGGNTQYLAIRLDHGNFAWASENVTIKTRLIGVVRTPSFCYTPAMAR